MRKSTMVELVEELKKLPSSPEIDFMIEEALAGEYHDFKNQKYICGKVESAGRLRKLGFVELAKRIEQGEFDEEADEEDNAKMLAELADQKNGMKLAEILGLMPKKKH